MKKVIIGVVLIFLSMSCDPSTRKPLDYSVLDCDKIKFKSHYQEYLNMGGQVTYIHYIYVENFDNKCFDFVDFLNVAQTYADTTRTNKPVSQIQFIGSIEDFIPQIGKFNWENIYKSHIVGFSMKTVNDSNKVSSVKFYKENRQFSVQLDLHAQSKF